MNAAPEKYQHVIRQAIEGTEVADDLICHGKTVLEHDQRLHKLVTKLEVKNLTLNSEKYTFRMNKNKSSWEFSFLSMVLDLWRRKCRP